MLKQAQLAATTIFVVIASTAGGVYLWWQSTPQYALLEAKKSFVEKERQRFNKFVDVAAFTTSFTEEIIFLPAEKTPNLSKMQRVIGLGALHAARNRIDNSLIFQMQRLVSKDKPKVTANAECDDAKPALVVEQPKKGFAGAFRSEWKKEKAKMKQAVLDRMSEFATLHPDTLVNRIFAAPRGHRANAIKQILADCGFKGSNFKKYLLEKKGTKYIAHLTFFSPRINNLVTVRFELERLHEGPFGRYRISRLVDFKQTLNHLKYDTDEQIHGLVAYGLQDLNGQSIAQKARGLLKKIGDSLDDDDDDDDDDGYNREREKRYQAEQQRLKEKRDVFEESTSSRATTESL